MITPDNSSAVGATVISRIKDDAGRNHVCTKRLPYQAEHAPSSCIVLDDNISLHYYLERPHTTRPWVDVPLQR